MSADDGALNFRWARALVDALVRKGVETFCVSPGSRSTPLAMAVAFHPNVRTIVHFDERGAAFHALGHARATNRPVAVICTSGTAVANLMPAVVEASMSRTPLILLTADRPPELQNCGANQTIHQRQFFGKYVRRFVNLGCPARTGKLASVVTAVGQVVESARQSPAGPAHINCMYREPLAPDPILPEDASMQGSGVAPGLVTAGKRSTATPVASAMATADELESLVFTCNAAARGLLIVGELRSEADQQAVRSLAARLNWPALPDVASNLRLGDVASPFLPFYDQALLSERFKRALEPDVVLQIGGSFVSKRLLQFLEAVKPQRHILMTDHSLPQDPAHSVTLRIEADIAKTCGVLAGNVLNGAAHTRLNELVLYDQAVSGVIERTLPVVSHGQLAEPQVSRQVSRMAPPGSVVFLGNSMPVRDMDMYGATGGPEFRVALNRGASGIDGNIATASGYASALARPVTAILGDLAALHDLNSLALLNAITTPTVIIVINNRGGGIFSFLPIARQVKTLERARVSRDGEGPSASSGSIFEGYFGTPHSFNFGHAAGMFGLGYEAPATVDQFAVAYSAALTRNGATLIEVSTEREANHQLHVQLQQEIVAALEA